MTRVIRSFNVNFNWKFQGHNFTPEKRLESLNLVASPYSLICLFVCLSCCLCVLSFLKKDNRFVICLTVCLSVPFVCLLMLSWLNCFTFDFVFVSIIRWLAWLMQIILWMRTISFNFRWLFVSLLTVRCNCFDTVLQCPNDQLTCILYIPDILICSLRPHVKYYYRRLSAV